MSSSQRCKLEAPASQVRRATVRKTEFPISFQSVLFETSTPRNFDDKLESPVFFHDLNLDQIVDAITLGREEYNLKPFFYAFLTSLDTITYRQEIMQELEDESLFESIKSFSNRMREMRLCLAATQSWNYKYSKERWLLDAVETYCEAIIDLQGNLER
ncbi:MAG: hypothetical protein ACREDS_10260, partial [Limisphaerales bacterium]